MSEEEDEHKKFMEEMYEEEARYNKAHLDEIQAEHARMNSTKYTNQLLEESLKVMEIIGKHTIKIYYVLLVIIAILAWIMFAVVFQVEPWWK